MPDVMVLPDSIARRQRGASDVRVFANGGLGAAGVQTARGGHRDQEQLERTLREPHIDRRGGSAVRREHVRESPAAQRTSHMSQRPFPATRVGICRVFVMADAAQLLLARPPGIGLGPAQRLA